MRVSVHIGSRLKLAQPLHCLITQVMAIAWMIRQCNIHASGNSGTEAAGAVAAARQ